MMAPAEGVKISTMATAITDEVIASCDIENKSESKKSSLNSWLKLVRNERQPTVRRPFEELTTLRYFLVIAVFNKSNIAKLETGSSTLGS